MVKKPKSVAVNTSTGEIVEEQLTLPFVRHPMARPHWPTPIDELSLTHQSHRDSCDINLIMGRYSRTGELPPADPSRVPQFADVSLLQEGDLTHQLEVARQANIRISAARKERIEKQKAETAELMKEAKALLEARKTASAASSAASAAPPATPPAGDAKQS